jgi:hypothetical protein
MQFGKAVFWISLTSILFAAIGAVVGYLIGTQMPGYYRSVFSDGGSTHFDPVAVGFGQGLSQGLVLGVAVGLTLVLANWWKEAKIASLAVVERSHVPTAVESAQSPVSKFTPEIEEQNTRS